MDTKAAQFASPLRGFARAVAGLAMAMGVLVLAGWALGIDSIKRVAPGLVAMNPLTAVAFVLAGLSLWLFHRAPARGPTSLAARLCAVAIIVLALLKIIGAAAGWKYGVDQLLFTHELSTPRDPFPNRMAPNTTLSFLLLGLALLLAEMRSARARAAGQVLAVAVAFFALLAVIGYLYGVTAFYQAPAFIPMALHTAAAFLLLSLAVLASRPDEALAAIVLSDTAGGFVARRLLPAVILIPAFLGWLRLEGQRAGFFDELLGISLGVVANILIFVTLIFLTAAMLYRLDLARQAAERLAHKLRAEAEAANHAKSDFLANMSHEIRTPMAAIIGYTDLMLDPNQTPSDRLDCVATVRRNGERLLGLVNDILDLSKIEAGKMECERVVCSPWHILHDLASTMRVKASEKDLEFDVTHDGLLPQTICTDPTRLTQILTNLVGNAVKFTDRGRVTLVARLIDPPGAPDPRLRFDVTDTGIGMTPEQLQRLFQPFTQADASTTRRFGGTGLGLTISRRLAEILGGQIAIESALGRGSTFRLTIPVGPLQDVPLLRHATDVIAPASVSRPRSATQALRGRVLLAEDGPDNQRLLSLYLRRAGLTVELASTGRAACDKARDADLVIMDMQMPEMDGYTAAATLRSRGYARPIIALTAHAMAHDRDKCLKSGCTDYLAKPVDKNDLLDMVALHLAQPAPAASTAAVAPAPAEAGHCLRSTAADECVQECLPEFVAGLPAQLDGLVSAFNSRDLDALALLVHRLKGAAGIYGFMPVTLLADRIEAHIAADISDRELAPQVKQLAQLVRRIENYDAAQERLANTGLTGDAPPDPAVPGDWPAEDPAARGAGPG